MLTMERKQDYFVGHFNAMASPCEVLIDTTSEPIARQICDVASNEATRIEHKFSRYRQNNIIYRINTGAKVTVDEETAKKAKVAIDRMLAVV